MQSQLDMLCHGQVTSCPVTALVCMPMCVCHRVDLFSVSAGPRA
jgi:hypothetical protein